MMKQALRISDSGNSTESSGVHHKFDECIKTDFPNGIRCHLAVIRPLHAEWFRKYHVLFNVLWTNLPHSGKYDCVTFPERCNDISETSGPSLLIKIDFLFLRHTVLMNSAVVTAVKPGRLQIDTYTSLWKRARTWL